MIIYVILLVLVVDIQFQVHLIQLQQKQHGVVQLLIQMEKPVFMIKLLINVMLQVQLQFVNKFMLLMNQNVTNF